MFNRTTIFYIIAIPLLLILGYYIFKTLESQKEDTKPPKIEKKLPQVKVEAVSYSTKKISIEQTGRLMSTGRVDMISEVSGKMLQGDVTLTTGQSFKKGDILLNIYDVEAKLALQAAKSRYLSSIANVLPDLKYDYSDNYSNWLKFFNSIKLDQTLPDFPEVISENEKIYLASKNIFNDYFTIKSSESILTKFTIKAPFKGSFSSVSLEVGAIASPGSRIAKMIRTDILELEVPLNIDEITYIKKGSQVEIDNHGKIITGIINRVSDFVDPASQSILVYVEVKNSPEAPLYEGMYMKANFAETELHDVMEVPRECLFNFDEVYIVKDGKLNKRRIHLIKVDEYSAYINGLEEGSQLVIESLINAGDQMPVRISK